MTRFTIDTCFITNNILYIYEHIVNSVQLNLQRLLALIKDKAHHWAYPGALGLHAILPAVWDVH